MVISELTKNVITKYSEPLLKQLIKFNKDEFEKLKIDFDFVFTKYLEKSYEKYSKIKTILYKTEPQYIYDFFEIPSIIKEPNISVNAEDVNNLLDISNFIILQGTGGIGKSTLLKHLFINELEKQDLIPIFFELKDINLIEGEYSIIDVLFNKLENLGSTLKKDYIEYALNSGCFLFFLDGFDEIISNKKDTFFQKLDAFCDKYTENFFIISSRPFSEFIEFQRFTVLKVLPLSKEQSISLISKINYDNDIKERFIHALEEQLYDSHTSFASNPLLLNIMLLTFDNYADIPEKLHLFYANAFETLYYKHDATKSGYKREMLSTLSYDSFKKVFAYFCFITYIKGTIEFTHEELRELFIKNKILKTEFNVDNYIYDLINSLCVLYKEGFSYSFAHRSFQEYFTAVFLKDLSDIKLQEYGLQMIRQEPIRAYHDKVFDMLQDMIEERYEKNILLPLFTEYEQTIPSNENKYLFYFKRLAHEIRFDYDENKNLRLWVHGGVTKEESLVKFMSRSANHSGMLPHITKDEYKESAHILFEYLKQHNDYKLCQEIKTDFLLENKNVVEIISKTWIGSAVRCVTNFKDYLTKKIEEDESTLDSIFGSAD